MYNTEIMYMDHHIGRLIESLKERGLYDSTWIIVTADHGELFGEHETFGHGKFLYQEEIHIPLIVKYPRGEVAPGTSDVPVQLVDLFPMICAHRNLPLPGGIQGQVPGHVDHPIIAETYPLEFQSINGHWRAIFHGNYKYLWNSQGNHLLVNLDVDPGENQNLLHREPEQAEKMQVALNGYLATLPKPGATSLAGEVDEETQRALKSLGYLD